MKLGVPTTNKFGVPAKRLGERLGIPTTKKPGVPTANKPTEK